MSAGLLEIESFIDVFQGPRNYSYLSFCFQFFILDHFQCTCKFEEATPVDAFYHYSRVHLFPGSIEKFVQKRLIKIFLIVH